MGICSSTADNEPTEAGKTAPEKAKPAKENKPQAAAVEAKKTDSMPPANHAGPGGEGNEGDIQAFNHLKLSIIRGWNHIMELIVEPIFQEFAKKIELKTYFEITPHKPMENFFRNCLAFSDPGFEVRGVDLDNSNSIDFERKKFQIFLQEVARTNFKKSLSLDYLMKELSKAVKATVESLEISIEKAKVMNEKKVLEDLMIIAQIFRILDEDEEE